MIDLDGLEKHGVISYDIVEGKPVPHDVAMVSVADLAPLVEKSNAEFEAMQLKYKNLSNLFSYLAPCINELQESQYAKFEAIRTHLDQYIEITKGNSDKS